MPTEIPAGATWPTQWRYDQVRYLDPRGREIGSQLERGPRNLASGIRQHTRTSLIRVYVEFTPGDGFPDDELERYQEQDGIRYASRYMNRKTLLDELGAQRPGRLENILERKIWGEAAGRGRIKDLIAVHIADGPSRN